MTDPHQFLRLDLGGMHFLLPSVMRYTIEQRDSLIPNTEPGSPVTAWRAVRTDRWPAYCLDQQLRLSRRDDWQRAVFLEAAPSTIGLIVDDVQMLPRADMTIAPFTPLGAPPTRHGHLFSGAWVSERRVTLVFEPQALIAYLQSLGG